MATRYDINCEQGATLRRQIIWRDADGEPVDLTGYSARMHVRETVESSAIVLECTTENGRITLGGETGVILLEVEAMTMEEINAPFTYRYDLELVVGPAPDVVRLIEGRFKVAAEVTRDEGL